MNKLIGAVITNIDFEDGKLFSITIEKDSMKNSITAECNDDEYCLAVWEKTK